MGTDEDCAVFLAPGRSTCWRLLLCCFSLAELDCQSKLFFSSVAVFPFCNRRGALSQVLSKKTCLLQIRVQKWSKTRRNVSSKGFKNPLLCFPVLVALHYPYFTVHLHCHSAGIFLHIPFDYATISIYCKACDFARQLLETLALKAAS